MIESEIQAFILKSFEEEVKHFDFHHVISWYEIFGNFRDQLIISIQTNVSVRFSIIGLMFLIKKSSHFCIILTSFYIIYNLWNLIILKLLRDTCCGNIIWEMILNFKKFDLSTLIFPFESPIQFEFFSGQIRSFLRSKNSNVLTESFLNLGQKASSILGRLF